MFIDHFQKPATFAVFVDIDSDSLSIARHRLGERRRVGGLLCFSHLSPGRDKGIGNMLEVIAMPQ
jgi:hypothetical protein